MTTWNRVDGSVHTVTDREHAIRVLQGEMERAASEMRYEEAAGIRDRLLGMGAPITYVAEEGARYGKRRPSRSCPRRSKRGK